MRDFFLMYPMVSTGVSMECVHGESRTETQGPVYMEKEPAVKSCLQYSKPGNLVSLKPSQESFEMEKDGT